MRLHRRRQRKDETGHNRRTLALKITSEHVNWGQTEWLRSGTWLFENIFEESLATTGSVRSPLEYVIAALSPLKIKRPKPG